MLFQNRMNELRDKVRLLYADERVNQENKLPENCWFLSNTEIVCFERQFGDSRYPYEKDGLTLWAYASGGHQIANGRFNIVLDSFFGGNPPNLCFYAGSKCGDTYFPISLTGAGKLPLEKNVKRYTVFAPEAAYYFTETDTFAGCVRMFVDEKQRLRFSVRVEAGEQEIDTYVAGYFNPLLRHAPCEDMATKVFKSCEYTEEGFSIRVVEDIFRSKCDVCYAHVAVSEQKRPMQVTTSYSDFTGSMHHTVNCSTALQRGFFEKQRLYTEASDNAVAAVLVPVHIRAMEAYELSLTVALSRESAKDAKKVATETAQTVEIDALLYDRKSEFGATIPDVQFENVQIEGVEEKAFNRFLGMVFRQIEFCARAKNYANSFMGIRDIFQQLEAALLWIPDYCRGKIIEALGYLGDDGRAPRQYCYPEKEGVLPEMDLRPFIDQGVWIISTIYTYLASTGDDSILDEECGYYHFEGKQVFFSDRKDSVLEHMIQIMDYLASHLDEKTGCLHILYGDWNDSLDGLGESEDDNQIYGTGVSVMATLQFYQNLNEMAQILARRGETVNAERYEALAERVAMGLRQYAIDENQDGQRRIIHGWGNEYAYKIGSFSDNDGLARDGLAANAFWVLSGMLGDDESLKQEILSAYERLDSKYGYKTFEPYFAFENKKVGRIINLPKGTAENGATYIHATMFAIWSLFEMGETEAAWKQLAKVLPLTHERLTHSPFVMSNSYFYNEERGLDGESMSDWFTGSGCVMAKIFIWYVFGIKADLDGITICPSKDMPFDRIQIKLPMKGTNICLEYSKRDCERSFIVNGIERASCYNTRKQAYEIRFTNGELGKGDLRIQVIGNR